MLRSRPATTRRCGAVGARQAHVVAFARGGERGGVTIAQRLPIRRGSGWDDTTLALPEGPWCNVLTGETIRGGPSPVEAVLDRFPVALLRTAE